jgi:hypothetical protein
VIDGRAVEVLAAGLPLVCPLTDGLGVKDAEDAFRVKLRMLLARPAVCEGPGLLIGVSTFVERCIIIFPDTARLSLER